jgi:hypothetical protein
MLLLLDKALSHQTEARKWRKPTSTRQQKNLTTRQQQALEQQSKIMLYHPKAASMHNDVATQIKTCVALFIDLVSKADSDASVLVFSFLVLTCKFEKSSSLHNNMTLFMKWTTFILMKVVFTLLLAQHTHSNDF